MLNARFKLQMPIVAPLPNHYSGFVGFIFYTQGLHLQVIEAAVGCAGLYFCTIFTEILLVLLATLAAVAGLGAVTYYLLSI